MTISDKCLCLDPQHTFRHEDQLRTSFYMDQNALVIFFFRYRSDLKILVEHLHVHLSCYLFHKLVYESVQNIVL